VSAINRLAEQMRVCINGLSTRIESLESSIDAKIKKEVQSAINPAVSKIKKDFNAEMRQIRTEVSEISKKCQLTTEHVQSTTARGNSDQTRALNAIVRNLPQSSSENTKERIENFIDNELKIRVSVQSAERKPARYEHDNGVIIVTFKSQNDKQSVMKAKRVLKNSRRYNNVYIENDMSPSERNNVNNLKTIASMLGNDKVYVRGSRLIPRSDRNDRSGRNVGNNRRSEQHGGWEEVRHGNRNHRRNQASTSRSHTARDAHSNEQYSQQRYHGNSQPSYIRRH